MWQRGGILASAERENIVQYRLKLKEKIWAENQEKAWV